jgi:hypothetical protein
MKWRIPQGNLTACKTEIKVREKCNKHCGRNAQHQKKNATTAAVLSKNLGQNRSRLRN